MKRAKTNNSYHLDPSRKILSGIAMSTDGRVTTADLEYIKARARKKSGDIQVISVHDGRSEVCVVFEYYGQAKGFKLLRYHFGKLVAAMTRNMNFGDILVNVIIKGNVLSGFPVHGAGKAF